MAEILICDDDDQMRRMVERVLVARGHSCQSFADGRSALEWLDEHDQTQVILSDYHLPDCDGARLLVEATKAAPSAVAILLSGVAGFTEAAEAVNQGGAFRLVAKPFAPDTLRRVVDEAVERHQQLRQRAEDMSTLTAQNGDLRLRTRLLEDTVESRTMTALDGLLAALDLRDPETQWHSRRVSLYARRLAQQVGLAGDTLRDVEWGALLHDIGKIGVRDAVLLKAAPLDETEWREMRRHPALGHGILSTIPFLARAREIVYTHHERWDGAGYPQRLRTTQIPIGARIFAIVDCYDAITSDRPYRRARDYDAARQEIVRCAGTQFDPDLVDAFLAVDAAEWAAIGRSIEDQRGAVLPTTVPRTARMRTV